jgi:drug/metabolite transporter (DMT)-like permease
MGKDSMTNHSSARGYLYVIIAACLWGTLGLWFRTLHDTYGMSSLTIAFLRAAFGCIILLIALAVSHRQGLRISRRSIFFFALFGLISISTFYVVYAQAAISTSVTTAVVLLYTAPTFVTLIAWRVWHESLDSRKIIAVVLAFIGCAFVARAYDPSALSLNFVGLLFGLAAGLTYALYTIFAKLALKDHSMWTTLTYSMVFGTIFLLPLQSPSDFAVLIDRPNVWIFVGILILGPTLGSYIFYNAALHHVPASNESIVATIEPVIASTIAFVFLGERLEILQMIGGAMVITGSLILSLPRPTPPPPSPLSQRTTLGKGRGGEGGKR